MVLSVRCKGFVAADNGRLPFGCQGRGQKNCLKKMVHFQAVCKPSRPGEVKRDSALGPQVLHKWFKQLRRLQALRFNTTAGSETPGAIAFRAQCWQAILTSSGFKPSFMDWWPSRLIQLQGAPSYLPFFCPDPSTVSLIFQDFHANFVSFERWTIRHKAKLTQLRKETEMKQLFKALRPEQKGALDTLQLERSATISCVDVKHNFDTLDNPNFSHSTEIRHQGHMAFLQPILVEEEESFTECLRLHSGILPVPGQVLSSCTTLTAFPDIEKELHKLWKPRWQAETTVPADAWRRILAFSQAHLPKLELTVPRLCKSDFLQLFRDSTGLRTTGPDGWSKADIQHLPDCLFQDVICLLERIEVGEPWPAQLVKGLVTCLEKVPDAKAASQFRPITLFSLWYRLWGSLRSRALLSSLEKHAAFHAYGYLRGRSCQQMTFFIQAAVEHALRTGVDLCGVLADIEKCFNFLPRAPIFSMARRMGFPSNVLTAWSSFLRQMVRAFRVQGEIGTFLDSDTGFPEGDSMSCLAMCIASFSYHHYMLHFQPGVTAFSFVDNLEVSATSLTDLLPGHVAMECWADLLRLRLDSQKTKFWATSADTRAHLRALGFHVADACMDLGTSMTYTASHRNSAMQQRILAVKPLWSKLRKLRVSFWHKLLVVRMALLPRALHDTALIVVGKHWLDKLRSGVMKALGCNRSGASPALRLSVLCPSNVDPWYFDAFHTLFDCHRHFQQSMQLCRWWRAYMAAPTQQRTYGPFAKLTTLLADLGWFLSMDLQLQLGPTFTVPFLELDRCILEQFFQHAWGFVISRQVRHRSTMPSLHGIDWTNTNRLSSALDRVDSALLHCVQDGTGFLESTKAKFDHTHSGQCLFCSAEDSLEHRALHCPHFSQIRSLFPEVLAAWHELPKHLTHHGLVSANPHFLQWWEAQHRLPASFDDWAAWPVDSGIQHVFVDGSCDLPLQPHCALAGWSCYLANSEEPLASGLLPLAHPTSDRAEVWAILMVLDWTAAVHCQVHIYTDSQYAYDGFVHIMRQGFVPLEWSNQLLWRRVQCSWERLSSPVLLTKVRAHRSLTESTTEHEAWLIRGNAIADSMAKTAVQTEGTSSFRVAMQKARDHDRTSASLAKRHQRFLLSLAKRSLLPCQGAEDPVVGLWPRMCVLFLFC